MATGAASRLTDGRVADREPAWSPDGRRIAFVSNRRRDPDLFSGHQDIHVVDVETRAVTAVTRGPRSSFYGPTWLPDGRTIAALGHRLEGGAGSRNDIWLFDADGADATPTGGRNLSGPHDLMPGSGMSSDVTRGEATPLIASKGGRWLYLSAPVDGSYELWRIAVADGRLERLTEDRHYISGWHAVAAPGRGGTRIAYLRSTATVPPDLWVLDSGRSRGPVGRRLTSLNKDVLADLALREPIERHATVDGRDIQGWFLPAGVPPGPLVVEIHGGPHTLYGWSLSWEFQLLAAAGIGVYYCNPRGSEGYGEAFNDANHRDWGPGPMRDVLAGVDALVADGLADPERLGVTGGSYGGYLTNWIVGHDHRFRAAMTCRSVADMSVLFTTGDISGRRLGASRVRRHAVGGPGLLPRDLADHLRRPDPDAAAHPALGARHPDDHRPGRGAVHRPALAAPAGAAAARPGGEPRADPLGDAVPAGREPARRGGLVPPLPGRGPARDAAPAAGPRPLGGSRAPRPAPRGTRCILSVP